MRPPGLMSGAQLLELRRQRMAASPPFLRGGFRPFFFGGAAWAVVAVSLWVAALQGAVSIPSALEPLAWHRHEMLFGFVGAIVAGFLLTAIPNWTGRLPIAGPPLALLFTMWLAGRIANVASAYFGLWIPALLDVGFYAVLVVLAAREVLAAKNRNVPIVALVLLFGVADAIDFGEALGLLPTEGLGIRCAIALVVILITLVGGRIVPSFTRNWLTKQGMKTRLPMQPNRFDLAAVAVTAAALLAWATGVAGIATGWLLVAAAGLQLVRLARWGGARTLSDPLVFILHVGYAWVPAGLLLTGLSALGWAISASVAIHALTAGAMATMILAVMTRATLGHTGRALRANGWTVASYILVTIGALTRVATGTGLIAFELGIRLTGVAWAGAFALFLAGYGRILWRPRADGD